MTGAAVGEAVVRAFEEQRGRLLAIAYRMLGSRADAEDAVQEAWLRLARQDPASVANLDAWLTTVVGRVCIDTLRSRRARPETPYGDRLPELVVTEETGDAPEDDVLLAESVGIALLTVLETLRPAERLAFILHDMFAVPFAEIAELLNRSPDATKMLASRARRKVRTTPQSTGGPREQRAVVDAFLAAARDGDLAGLVRLLDPDVTWRDESARGVVVRRGAAQVARRAQRTARGRVTAQPVLVNGEAGLVGRSPDGRPLVVMACTVVDGRIAGIVTVTDPTRLASLDLPDE